uniref:cyclic GMP-AMP synthase DncV-like nucleotidyltransferase n=1 Tax=Flavobacterium sp. TaxID=239 RepID=UPI00404B0F3C
MANCHNLFGEFNTEISLTSNKKTKMNYSKDKLRERIRKHFKENHSEYIPKFYIQGSYKMKTGIRTKDDICDLDDGVYFFRTPDVTATTLQNWIWDAVNGYTKTSPEHRKKMH